MQHILIYKMDAGRGGHLHPSSMITMVYSFSASVLGATFPNPTDIRPVKQK